MVLYSLCVLIKALSFRVMGFICIRCFCWFLSITVLYLCIFLGFVLEMIPWDPYLIVLFDYLLERYRSFV